MGLWKNGLQHEIVRVFLLIGNRLLRESLLRLFRKPGDLSIVGVGSPGMTDPTEIENCQCDVLVTDQFPAKTLNDSVAFCDQWTTLQMEILLLGMDEDQDQFLSAVSRRSGLPAKIVHALDKMGVGKNSRRFGPSRRSETQLNPPSEAARDSRCPGSHKQRNRLATEPV